MNPSEPERRPPPRPMRQDPTASRSGSQRSSSQRSGAKKPPATSRLVSSRAEATRVRRMGSIVSQLISRRGYASVMSDDQITGSIRTAVPDSLAGSFRVGKLRAGVLQILVCDSVTLQEFNFQKRKIIRQLAIDVPDKVKDLRFRVEEVAS